MRLPCDKSSCWSDAKSVLIHCIGLEGDQVHLPHALPFEKDLDEGRYGQLASCGSLCRLELIALLILWLGGFVKMHIICEVLQWLYSCLNDCHCRRHPFPPGDCCITGTCLCQRGDLAIWIQVLGSVKL